MLCACGCGVDAGVYRKTAKRGQPRVFIHGHNTRKPVPTEKACSCCGEMESADAFYTETRSVNGQPYTRRSSRCKVCTRAKSAAWIRANPERHARTAATATARWRSGRSLTFIEDVDPAALYEMYGGMCWACKEFIDLTSQKMHMDHLRPISKGGAHGYINVRPMHALCNLRKGAREEIPA